MPPISTRFAPPKARRALPVSENPETTRSREYHRAQFGFEAERRRIATKHRTRKSRAIDKLVKEEHFQSLDAAAQEQAIQQIKADCSEAAAEELAQVEESWKRLTEVVSDEDDSGEADDEGGERTGGLDGEPMEGVMLGAGEGAEEEDDTPRGRVPAPIGFRPTGSKAGRTHKWPLMSRHGVSLSKILFFVWSL